MNDYLKTAHWLLGVLSANKGINFPERTIYDLPAVSAKDKEDLAFALTHNVDFVSVSCLRDEEDVQELRYFQGILNIF